MPRGSDPASRSTVLDAIAGRRYERESPQAGARGDLVYKKRKKTACDVKIGPTEVLGRSVRETAKVEIGTSRDG